MKIACAECCKRRKCMVFDWLSKQWFCVKDYKELLKDYRGSLVKKKRNTQK